MRITSVAGFIISPKAGSQHTYSSCQEKQISKSKVKINSRAYCLFRAIIRKSKLHRKGKVTCILDCGHRYLAAKLLKFVSNAARNKKKKHNHFLIYTDHHQKYRGVEPTVEWWHHFQENPRHHRFAIQSSSLKWCKVWYWRGRKKPLRLCRSMPLAKNCEDWA